MANKKLKLLYLAQYLWAQPAEQHPGTMQEIIAYLASCGISAERAVDYKCDEVGTALNYDVISEAICTVRASRPLSPGWKARIDADVKKRGR